MTSSYSRDRDRKNQKTADNRTKKRKEKKFPRKAERISGKGIEYFLNAAKNRWK
jgi:hypothetical protein